jgi:hypothetical protein
MLSFFYQSPSKKEFSKIKKTFQQVLVGEIFQTKITRLFKYEKGLHNADLSD